MKTRLAWIVAFAVTLGGGARAVEPGKPSKTALMAAAFRAIGARNPDVALRNPDYLAGKFLRPQDLDLLAANGADYRPQLKLKGDALSQYLRGSIAVTTNFVRTRHIDATLEQSLDEGAGQVVVLGAGLDSRGYRFAARMSGTRFLEVDFPPTQEYKKSRVRSVLGKTSATVRYVGMDFTKDDLLAQLGKGGYSEREKTLFIWEGVIPYIPEPAVRATLRFVAAHSAPGSRIVFDYPLDTNARIYNPANIFSRWGEPFVFGFPDGGPDTFIRAAGLQTVSDLSNTQLVAKYAIRADGSSSLRLPDPNGGAKPDVAGIAVAEVRRR